MPAHGDGEGFRKLVRLQHHPVLLYGAGLPVNSPKDSPVFSLVQHPIHRVRILRLPKSFDCPSPESVKALTLLRGDPVQPNFLVALSRTARPPGLAGIAQRDFDSYVKLAARRSHLGRDVHSVNGRFQRMNGLAPLGDKRNPSLRVHGCASRIRDAKSQGLHPLDLFVGR